MPAAARWGAPPVIALLLIVAFFAFIFQWNWLRGPLANWAGANLHRQVTISGDLHVRPWSWSPAATVDGVTIGNPAWAGPGPMAKLPRSTLTLDLRTLLHGKLALPLVSLSQPDVRLLRAADGRANWNFGAGGAPSHFRVPAIRRLVIVGGALRLEDQPRKLVFSGTVSTDEQPGSVQPAVFKLSGQGTRDGHPFVAQVAGGPLLNIDPNRVYPFHAQFQSGTTRVAAEGTIPHPFDLSRFSAKTRVSGENLAQLYALTDVVLPRTPPYVVTTDLTRVNGNVDLRAIRGRFGDSDLAGSLSINDDSGRRRLTGDLVSRRLQLADLAAVIGAPPRRLAGHTVSPEQAATAAQLRAEHRILPDVPLHLERLRVMDAAVAYRAQSVVSGTSAVRDLRMNVKLDRGVLLVQPLTADMRSGELTGWVRFDARHATPAEAIDLRLAGTRIEDFIGKRRGELPAEGAFLARARLVGSGDSVRAAASDSSGAVTMVIPHGEIRQSLAELLGINVANGAFLLLTKNQSETPVRCGVANFSAQNGVLTARNVVLDTGVVLSTGSGTVNLRDETVDLRLEGKPKKFRIGRLSAPITVKGRLESPKVGVDLGKAAPQFAVAGLLAGLVSPLAVILPFVNLGLAHDADCSALLAEASAGRAPVAAHPNGR